MPVQRDELATYLKNYLNTDHFVDYAPNGLQVEGKPQINKIVYGVTSSLKLIDEAIKIQADAIIVHHGLFWRGQNMPVIGWMKQRLQQLLKNDINLYAYHLPLDAHPIIGNNAMLAKALKMDTVNYIGEQKIIAVGDLPQPLSLDVLTQEIHQLTHRQPLSITGDGRMIHRVSICSGGAQNYFTDAIAANVDAFITGEISEPQAHLARETGVAFIAAGHHATERFGIQALAQVINKEFKLAGTYIEIDNPA